MSASGDSVTNSSLSAGCEVLMQRQHIVPEEWTLTMPARTKALQMWERRTPTKTRLVGLYDKHARPMCTVVCSEVGG